MRNIWTLLKIITINNLMILKKRDKKNLIFAGVFCLVFMWMFYIKFYDMMELLSSFFSVISPVMVLRAVTNPLLVMGAINGLYFGSSVLYYNKDINLFSKLPVSVNEILMTSLLYSVSKMGLFILVFGFPMLLSYGRYIELSCFSIFMGMLYTLSAVVAGNAFVMSGYICAVSFYSKRMNRKSAVYLSHSTLIFLVFLVILKVNSVYQTLGENIGVTSYKYDLYRTYLSTLSDWKPLAGYSFLFLLAVLIYLYCGNKKYYASYERIQQDVKKNKENKRRNPKEYLRAKPRPSILIFLVKEMKSIFRVPEYMLNCLAINIVLPVILWLCFVINRTNLAWLEIMENIRAEQLGLTLYWGMCIVGFLVNKVSVTALSREGVDINILKYIPIKQEIIILSKIGVGVLLTLPSVLGYGYIYNTYLHIPVFTLILCGVATIPGMILAGVFGMYIETINFPKNVSQKLMLFKNNINILLHFLITAAIFAPIVWFQIYAVTGEWNVILYYLGIFMLLSLGGFLVLVNEIKTKIFNIEI